jgi:hypothetical protein
MAKAEKKTKKAKTARTRAPKVARGPSVTPAVSVTAVPAVVTTQVQPFVIMLDNLLEVLPNHWPISEEAATLEEARLKRQHRGNPIVIPRDQLRMRVLENKSLIDAETGRVDHGAIYAAREV